MKKYQVMLFDLSHSGMDSETLEKLLNQGWKVDRADVSPTKIIYILWAFVGGYRD